MDFEGLSTIEHKKIDLYTIIFYPEVYELLCYYPYPDHPNGCPNIGKCRNDDTPYFGSLLFDGYMHYYLLYLIFGFKQYKKLRKIENPAFFNTEKRVNCLLYYQNSLKKIIKDYIEDLYNQNKDFYVLGCGSGFKLSFQERVDSMEAVGINVFSTMKMNKISFEIKPVNRVVFCNLLLSNNKIVFTQKYKYNSILSDIK